MGTQEEGFGLISFYTASALGLNYVSLNPQGYRTTDTAYVPALVVDTVVYSNNGQLGVHEIEIGGEMHRLPICSCFRQACRSSGP